MTLESANPRSKVEHSTTEPLHLSLVRLCVELLIKHYCSASVSNFGPTYHLPPYFQSARVDVSGGSVRMHSPSEPWLLADVIRTKILYAGSNNVICII